MQGHVMTHLRESVSFIFCIFSQGGAIVSMILGRQRKTSEKWFCI